MNMNDIEKDQSNPIEEVVSSFIHKNSTFSYDVMLILTYAVVVALSLGLNNLFQKIFSQFTDAGYITSTIVYILFLFALTLLLIFITKRYVI